jgi:hypothetical protein
MLPMPRPNWEFLINPWGFTAQALLKLHWGLAPLLLLFLEVCPWASNPMTSPPGLWKSIFCPHRASTMIG